MKIVGLDALIFGVDDVRLLRAFSLTTVSPGRTHQPNGGRFEALDGTAAVIAREDNPALPSPPAPGCRLRKTVMGVADVATLEAISAELRRDREVRRFPTARSSPVDDSNFVIGFQVTVRKRLVLPGELSNAPGGAMFRPVNHLGVPPPGCGDPPALSLARRLFRTGHATAEAFYVNRLGFEAPTAWQRRGAVPEAGRAHKITTRTS